MPNYLSHIVRVAIRNYCNLNNAELAKNYDGPLRLIRRTEDEIIAEYVGCILLLAQLLQINVTLKFFHSLF